MFILKLLNICKIYSGLRPSLKYMQSLEWKYNIQILEGEEFSPHCLEGGGGVFPTLPANL